MTPEDKKVAKCNNCEKYYDNITAAHPLGWCREGYGRAIHTLTICPKEAERQRKKLERKAENTGKVKVQKVAQPNKKQKLKPKKKEATNKPLVVVVKKKKMVGEKE